MVLICCNAFASSPAIKPGGANYITMVPTANNTSMQNPDTFENSPAEEKDAKKEEGKEAKKVDQAIIKVEVGANHAYSNHVKTYNIPFSINVIPDLKFGIVAPYLLVDMQTVSGTETKVNGIGDIASYLRYRYGNENNILQGVTQIGMSFPTGNYKRYLDNWVETISLGTGTYSVNIDQNFSKVIGNFKVVANLGYTMSIGDVSYDFNANSSVYEHKYKVGNILNYGIHLDYKPTANLALYLKATGLSVDRGRESLRNVYGTFNSEWDRYDSMSTLDITPGIKYRIWKDVIIRLGAVIPAWTQHDSDTPENMREKREYAIDFGLNASF